MKLKTLNITIMSPDEFINNINGAIYEGKAISNSPHTISVDSLETFRKLLSPNKLHILMVISRLKPSSINQVAKLTGRDFPHVLKDCRALELMGLIKLEEANTQRKQFIPKLKFDYDIIRVKAPIEEIYSISERSNKVLLGETRL